MVLESRDPRDLCGKGPAGSRLHPTHPRTSAPQSPDLAEAETEEVMSPWGPSVPSEGPRHLTLFKAGIVGTVSGLGQGASLGPQPCNQLAV